MLDRISGGRYRSTPHRVRNVTGRNRLSFPFFFDPNFDAEVKPIALADADRVASDRMERTLFPSYSPLHDVAQNAKIGKPVLFSGRILDLLVSTDDETIAKPQMVARFTALKVGE